MNNGLVEKGRLTYDEIDWPVILLMSLGKLLLFQIRRVHMWNTLGRGWNFEHLTLRQQLSCKKMI